MPYKVFSVLIITFGNKSITYLVFLECSMHYTYKLLLNNTNVSVCHNVHDTGTNGQVGIGDFIIAFYVLEEEQKIVFLR